jgi:PAS domain S-box-containing protein
MPLHTREFLRRRHDDIMREWEHAVRSESQVVELEHAALRDHLPQLLNELAEWMESGEPVTSTSLKLSSAQHAANRLEHTFQLKQLVKEYRLLREVILRLLLLEETEQARNSMEGKAARVAELARLNAGLDAAISSGVEAFSSQREGKLLAVQERLELALHAADVGAWDFDPPTGTLVCDARCKALFGLPADAPVGTDAFIAGLHPDDKQRAEQAVKAALRGENGGDFRNEYRTVGIGDGIVRWVDTRGKAFFDSAGRATRFIGTVLDITERKSAETLREQFLGILGHDLRNPLHTIVTAAAFMWRSGKLPPGLDRALAGIARAAERMTRMIRDLLDLTRGRIGGGIPITPASIDMADVCRAVVEEMSMAYPERSVSVQAHGQFESDWDRDRAHQAVGNLVGNAIEHGSDPVVVSLTRSDDEVVVAVTNAGDPIPEDRLRILFEPYHRVGEGHGLGLGLYIVSEIMRAHGGKVEVASSRENGTTFSLHWPRHREGPRASGGPGGP